MSKGPWRDYVIDDQGRTCTKCRTYKSWNDFYRNGSQYRPRCKKCHDQYPYRQRALLKREVMDAYGGKCACCGELELAFLCIDHVNNDGSVHRRQLGTKTIYGWLRKNDYPEGFQVLCWNCNAGKAINGGVCPHVALGLLPLEAGVIVPIVTVQSFLLDLLDGLELPYGMPALEGNITPPDPRIKAKVPAAYIWPSPGEENRSAELGGTAPRNSGFGTPSGTKGMLHQFDIYITWTGARNKGKQTDPIFPGIIDTVMAQLRYSQPNPVELTDPNTGLTSTVYNVGEVMHYQVGLEDLADERLMRYDCLITCSVWEILNA